MVFHSCELFPEQIQEIFWLKIARILSGQSWRNFFYRIPCDPFTSARAVAYRIYDGKILHCGDHFGFWQPPLIFQFDLKF